MIPALILGLIFTGLAAVVLRAWKLGRLERSARELEAHDLWSARFHAHGARLAADAKAPTALLRDLAHLNALLRSERAARGLVAFCQTAAAARDDGVSARTPEREHEPPATVAAGVAALSAGLMCLSYLDPRFESGARVFWAEAYGVATGLLGDATLLWALGPLTETARALALEPHK